MEKESCYGQMVLNIRVNGDTDAPLAEVFLHILKVKFMKVSGNMTKLKAMAFMFILTVQGMKANGIRIYSMAKEPKDGQMVLYL